MGMGDRKPDNVITRNSAALSALGRRLHQDEVRILSGQTTSGATEPQQRDSSQDGIGQDEA